MIFYNLFACFRTRNLIYIEHLLDLLYRFLLNDLKQILDNKIDLLVGLFKEMDLNGF